MLNDWNITKVYIRVAYSLSMAREDISFGDDDVYYTIVNSMAETLSKDDNFNRDTFLGICFRADSFKD